ncbi:MAG: hypothetical protein A4S14_10455 [Proteobacteria bacterium SG_bin9]|nr:MAG: hypothetical protein A4S14_10455 [Proteobacteria bacterium SG_bin9]
MTLDEIRSTLFGQALHRLRDKTLANDEPVLWQGQPDPVNGMLVLRVLWAIGLPWLILTYMAFQRGWIGEAATPLALIGLGLTAGPFVKALYDMQTLYAITDRRAIILRTAWGKPSVYSSPFAIMDRKLEVLAAGRGAAHLNFRSGVSARLPDSDYTGRYGFRSIRDVESVRTILENASRNLRGKEK